MTTEEFSNEFDILLNVYAQKPEYGHIEYIAVDEYEKSVYLTQAQREYIDNILKQSLIDYNEEIRRILHPLVRQANLVVDINPTGISNNSYTYETPIDLYRILQEEINITMGLVTKTIPVRPIRHDEYNTEKNNPFKQPLSYGLNPVAWRLELNETDKFIEVIAPSDINTLNSYTIRYITQPPPIILTNLVSDGLTIEGLDTVRTCVLNEACHLDILKMAVLKALQTKQIIKQ